MNTLPFCFSKGDGQGIERIFCRGGNVQGKGQQPAQFGRNIANDVLLIE